MKIKEVEIFYGDIGSVSNNLSKFMKENVDEIISLTQSVTASLSHTNPMLTIVLVYTPYVECPPEIAYQPTNKKENYL